MVRTSKSISPQKLAREKTLNLIYFIDSNSTRSIRMSLGKVWCIAALLIAVLCWAFGSGWLLYRSTRLHQREQTRIQQLQAGIFKYQNNSDAVYESAYPNGPNPSRLSKSTDDQVAKSTMDQGEMLTALAPSPKTIAVKKEKLPPTPVEKKVVSKPVDVEVSKVLKKSNRLVVKYMIKNDANSAKVEGRVWAVARYTALNGRHHFVADPPGVGVTEGGDPIASIKGTRFFIRRFRNVDSRFNIPANIVGRFDKVVIYTKTTNGALVKKDLKVDIDVGYKKPVTETKALTPSQPLNSGPEGVGTSTKRTGMSAKNGIETKNNENLNKASPVGLGGH